MNLIEVEPRDGFSLSLRYDDGVEGVVDLASLAARGDAGNRLAQAGPRGRGSSA